MLQEWPTNSRASDDAFIRQLTEEILSKLEDILSKSFRLQSGLGKFLLLRACFGACRESRLLRSLGFEDGLFLASQDEQFTLACMASRRGGLWVEESHLDT